MSGQMQAPHRKGDPNVARHLWTARSAQLEATWPHILDPQTHR